jgi:hypothetical protein
MNKLIVALCASAFTFGSAAVLAQGDNDMKPLSKMETQDAKAARAAAKAKWASMTPEQQAAAKKAAQAKKQADLTAMDNQACNFCYDTKQAAADAAASKAMAPPTKAQRQQDATTMDKQGDSSLKPLPPATK